MAVALAGKCVQGGCGGDTAHGVEVLCLQSEREGGPLFWLYLSKGVLPVYPNKGGVQEEVARLHRGVASALGSAVVRACRAV